jgi:hypothetical protein
MGNFHNSFVKLAAAHHLSIFLLLLQISVLFPPSTNAKTDGHKSIGELLSGLIYDQEMRVCCERIQQIADFSILNCSTVKDGVLPVANGGYANPNYYNYFWNCISRRYDNRECCREKGVR